MLGGAGGGASRGVCMYVHMYVKHVWSQVMMWLLCLQGE